MNDMKALLTADELAKDMSGAEAMLQRHRERKGEIDAQEDSFKAATHFGQSLISSGHFASEEVKKEVGKRTAFDKVEYWMIKSLLVIDLCAITVNFIHPV